MILTMTLLLDLGGMSEDDIQKLLNAVTNLQTQNQAIASQVDAMATQIELQATELQEMYDAIYPYLPAPEQFREKKWDSQ